MSTSLSSFAISAVSVVTQASSDVCDSVVIAISMVSSMSTSTPKEASTPVHVQTPTRTDAIIEEEDIMPRLLGKDAGPLDRK